MTGVYKIMEKLDREMFFSFSHITRTRGHPLKLNGGRFRTDKRKLTKLNRGTQCHEIFSRLPICEVFKGELDKYVEIKGIRRY